MSQLAHHLAPLPILLGVLLFIVGLFWIVGADLEENDRDGFAFGGMFFSFTRAIVQNPAACAPGVGFLVAAGC